MDEIIKVYGASWRPDCRRAKRVLALDPNTGFVKGSVDLDDRGLVLTEMGLQTSMQGVFAAGDVRSGSTKQLASAVSEGAAAAIGIRLYPEPLEARPMHEMVGT
jgi:thioredoxin reductase